MNIPIDGHSCSYYCDRPECIKAQRDELRATLERVKAAEAGLPVEPETFKFAMDIDTPVAYVVLKDDYDTLSDYAVQMKAALDGQLLNIQPQLAARLDKAEAENAALLDKLKYYEAITTGAEHRAIDHARSV